MTDALREYVQQGGRVLWLAEQSRLAADLPGDLGIAQRAGHGWQGDWASNFNWIRQDRMFQHIPTGGTVDFAFADLIPDHGDHQALPRPTSRAMSTPACSWAGCTTPSRWWPSGRSPAAGC